MNAATTTNQPAARYDDATEREIARLLAMVPVGGERHALAMLREITGRKA